jgi:hypothetical protein
MRSRITVIAFLLFAVLTFAQDKPANVSASRDAENRILKAEHAHDQVAKEQASVNLQMQTLQVNAKAQWDTLQKQQTDLDTKEKATSKEVDAAIEEAWKESGLDKSKYDFDAADFTYKPKAPPAQAKK